MTSWLRDKQHIMVEPVIEPHIWGILIFNDLGGDEDARQCRHKRDAPSYEIKSLILGNSGFTLDMPHNQSAC